MSSDRLARNYDRAAWGYQAAAHVFSLGQIRASKSHAVDQICPGSDAIFLGVGTGEDAILAAEKGVNVTCVDFSQKMLNGLQRKLDQKGLKAELICQDVIELECFGQFDCCVANYFLNVFCEAEMHKFIQHAARFLKTGGKFLIADVARSQGNVFYRAFNVGYLKWAMLSSWLLGLVPLHRNYDYPAYFAKAELALSSIEYFPLFPGGPVVYQCIIAEKLS